MPSPPSNPPLDPIPENGVFVSYAHADNENDSPKLRWLDRFLTFLKPFVRDGQLTVFADTNITSGERWHDHIQARLAACKAAVLLVSPDFLASDYIASSELPVLLKAAADRGLKIICILVAPCSFDRATFKYPDPKAGPERLKLSSLQAANPPTRTLLELTEARQNRVLMRVAEYVADLIETRYSTPPPPPTPAPSGPPSVPPPPASAPSIQPPRPSGGGHSNVPAPSATFVPRPDVTSRIHAALTSGTGAVGQAAARAYGGYGKTVAAIMYAHEYAPAYPGGCFFLSMENADFTQQLASLGRYFNVPPDAPPPQAASLVTGALTHGKPSLLILDNIADAAQWKDINATGLLPGGACRTLITTRAEAIPKTRMIQVGRLTNEQARDLYARFCSIADDRDESGRSKPTAAVADAITDRVGGLAVAVGAIAAHMKLHTSTSWESYLASLRDIPLERLPDASPEVLAELGHDAKALEDHRRTLNVIDAAIDSLPPPERRAVEYAALLPEDMVPGIWLEWLLNEDAKRPDGPLSLALPPDPTDPTPAAWRVIHHLDKLDVFLPTGEGGKLLGLHRLWRQRLNERAESEKHDLAPLRSAIAACAIARRAVIVGGSVNNPAAITDQSLRWELAPLATVCKAMWEGSDAGTAAGIGVWLASILHDVGRLVEAAACLTPVRDHEAAVEQAIGHANLAACYSNLALIQQDQGDLPGARASMERTIDIERKHFDPDHPTLATSYSNLATIQKNLNDLPAALASIERAIAIDRKHFDPDDPTLAIRYSNLAMIQKNLNDLPAARASIERAIAIDRKHFDSDHLSLATMYSNLATIQQAQDDLPGARASIEQGIAIKQKHLDPDHPTFAISYNNLAHLCFEEGNHEAACANLKRALAILRKHFDENHPHVKIVRASMKAVGCGE